MDTGVYIKCGKCKALVGIESVFVSFLNYHRIICICGETYYVTISFSPHAVANTLDPIMVVYTDPLEGEPETPV